MDHPLPIPDLPADLRDLVGQIPRGRVATCGGLAEALGNVVAARWVGQFVAQHPHDGQCGCHRVVLKGGVLQPSWVGGEQRRIRRLRDEGIEVRGGAVDFQRFGWSGFRSSRPLARLAELQQALVSQAVVAAPRRRPALVAGVDAAYPAPGEAVAAYALVEVESGQLVWSHVVRRPVRFPYITSYLSFRELPLHLELLAEARRAGRLADVVLVDGSGMLHPRHAGIATHLGVTAGVATVGVTKKLLCGECRRAALAPGESCPVVFQGRPVGVALRPTAGSARPIFLSVGHRVNLALAEAVVRRLLEGRRLPAPVYWADRLARQAARDG